MATDRTLVVVLSPGFPSDQRAKVQAVSPSLHVVQLTQPDEVPPEAAAAEVLAWWDHRRSALELLLPALPRLHWVQSPVAGIGDQQLHEVLGSQIILTSGAGVYADLVAEHALMLMLALYRRLDALIPQQERSIWQQLETRSLSGQTLGIVGAGGIGQAAARMAHAFGMHTIGIRRGGELAPYLHRTLSPEALPELLCSADVVLLAMPLTQQTRGLIDATALQQMRRTAVLVNVARGPVVVTDALVRALHEGWIAGAGLDVTDPEPLPADHPLWHCPGVIITPHHGNPPALSEAIAVDRFCQNLRRYLAGDPLIALVDPQRGY